MNTPMLDEAEKVGVRAGSSISTPSVSSSLGLWFGKIRQRSDIVFISQILVIYTIISVSLFNLSRGSDNEQQEKVWMVLLSSCLGYVLPNPKLAQRQTTQ